MTFLDRDTSIPELKEKLAKSEARVLELEADLATCRDALKRMAEASDRGAEQYRKVLAENQRLTPLVADGNAVLGRLRDWTHEMGKALVPRGPDTYGEGVRDCKAQVGRILDRFAPKAVAGQSKGAGWIPVAERRPEPNSGYVLGFMPNGRYWITWINEEGRWRGTDPNYPPTHWMPLPEPPQLMQHGVKVEFTDGDPLGEP